MENREYPNDDGTEPPVPLGDGQYQWPGQPRAADQPQDIDMAIDPRLYDDRFAQWGTESADYSTSDMHAILATQQAALQDHLDLSEPSTNSENEGIWSEEEADYAQEDKSDSDAGYTGSEAAPDEEDEEGAASSSRRKRKRRGHGPFSGRFGARGGKGIKRGPRKPLEPGPEFKLLHSQATNAFIDGDYDKAIDLVQQAIIVNPEMFAAHSLLSEIFLARGEHEKAVTALFSAAHTRPRSPTVWYKVAKLIQDTASADPQKALTDRIYCYSRVIEIDPKNFNARFHRAAAYRELGYNGRAAAEYERILKELPHDVRALRRLAETYIDMQDVQKAIDYYMDSIDYYLSLDAEDNPEFGWSDLNICLELLAYEKQYKFGLRVLATVSRWLLGRSEDTIWDNYLDDDDREWDASHSPRRIKTDGFMPGMFPEETYGLGLPLELRIKLGIFRLKLGERHVDETLRHFEWLTPDDRSDESKVYDYGDLFREAADALKDAGLFDQALRYYEPLQFTEEYANITFFLAIGDCAFACGKNQDAANYYMTVVESDSSNLQARVNLAKLYEEMGDKERALYFVNQAVLLGREEAGGRRRARKRDRRIANLARELQGPDGLAAGNVAPRSSNILAQRDVLDAGTDRAGHVQYLYSKMNELRPAMRKGDEIATEDWLDIADALLRDFRSNRAFYPLQKNMTFLGYAREAQKKGGKKKEDLVLDEMQEMAGRLQESLGNLSDERMQATVPTDYYGISFTEWLEIFLEYAYVVSGQGDSEEAYNVLAGAADASIYHHSKEKMRQIHICWIACALRLQDEETLVSEVRWFSKEYQFITDTYRMFSLLSRVCGNPHKSLFNASPNMKFMLRQVKAMDYSMPGSTMRKGKSRDAAYQEKASLTTRNEHGEFIRAESMDVALLVLYGHILYSGNSFLPALNYYFRAHALDKNNPSILLSIGLCYIHQAVKRQAENRHYMVFQGLSFMTLYRESRERQGCLPVELQEVEVNFGRLYHSLGLLHQATVAYERALQLGEQIQADAARRRAAGESVGFVEDFSTEAAVALQNIYALSGDTLGAREVTEKYLVV